MQLLLIFALIFALGVAIFAIQNANPVDISFLFYKFHDISLVLVILISVLTGALIVFLLSLVSKITYLRKIRALEKQNESLENKLQSMDKTGEKNLKDGCQNMEIDASMELEYSPNQANQ